MTALVDEGYRALNTFTELLGVIKQLEAERDYYKRQTVKWASEVDRQRLPDLATRVQFDELQKRVAEAEAAYE